MKSKKNLKGFTLVELIVVMAVFGLIMLGALQFLDPVNKMMRGASVQEANTAAVDNVKRYFEGTLRYANAVDVYSGELIGGEEQAAIDFVNRYYMNRVDSNDDPVKLDVHIMKIDNDDQGKISECVCKVKAGYTYKEWNTALSVPNWDYIDRDNPKTVSAEKVSGTDVTPYESVINDVYYQNYSMFVTLGYSEMKTANVSKENLPDELGRKKNEHYFGRIEEVAENYPFDENHFIFTFTTYKNDKNSDGDPIYRRTVGGEELFVSPYSSANASLALMNITSAYGDDNRATFGFCPERREGNDGTTSYNHNTPVTDENGDVIYSANPYTAESNRYFHQFTSTGNNIYIVYTLPN